MLFFNIKNKSKACDMFAAFFVFVSATKWMTIQKIDVIDSLSLFHNLHSPLTHIPNSCARRCHTPFCASFVSAATRASRASIAHCMRSISAT